MPTHTAWLPGLRYPSLTSLEQYLESQASAGRHLRGLDRLSSLRMQFDKGEPATVRYVVEKRQAPAPIDYFRFREEAGWDHVGAIGSTHVWRREYTGARPEGLIGRRTVISPL